MADNSPRLDLPYIQPAQAQKHVTHNEALRVLDVLVQLSVVAFDATTPPSLPVEGDIYALGAGANGDWTGHDGALALYVDGYWQFHTPQPGWIATGAGSDTLRIWRGSEWAAPSPDDVDNLQHLGINTTADATNRLALSAPASLFSHEGSDHRMKVNKAGAVDTASLLFQSGWSGRAEIGLAGSDDLSIKVSADGSSWTEALAIDPANGALSTSDATMAGVALAAIDASLTETAVDLCVYDTGSDSDGGWRDRSAGASWRDEPLRTATRGTRRDFPAVAVIIAEANTLTIYDADDPDLPMWRVQDFTGSPITCVAARDGKVIVGRSGGGISVLDFAADEIDVSPGYTTTTTPAIVNDLVNDVAVTVRPGAPVAPVTGLPVPTIAVATDGGVSVINNEGSVDSTAGKAQHVMIADGFVYADYSNTLQRDYVAVWPIENTASVTLATTGPSGGGAWHYDHIGSLNSGVSLWLLGDGDAASVDAFLAKGAVGTASGLSFLSENPATPGNGMVAYITASFATGWMSGDIKGAFLADTDATDLVGGTDADRSVNGVDLTVTGTITRAPVATGAELVAYSGFSASNYLEQPYNADLDFGTGDFCVMGWAKTSNTSAQNLVVRGDTGRLLWGLYALNNDVAFILGGGFGVTATGALPADSSWHFIVVLRLSGVLYLYVDGALADTQANTFDVSGDDESVYIGTNRVFTNTWDGSLALLRISGTAPTAEQIAQIYADELPLFRENAACTLSGASDAVTALAHDPVTGLLHAGTSAGRSTFRGLRRIEETADPVTTAIAAQGGLIVEQ